MDKLKKFFQDKDGKLAVFQWPNVPLSAWIILSIVSMFVPSELSRNLHLLSSMFLFVWAYLEITSGVSMFRRTFGAVVFIYILLTTLF